MRVGSATIGASIRAAMPLQRSRDGESAGSSAAARTMARSSASSSPGSLSGVFMSSVPLSVAFWRGGAVPCILPRSRRAFRRSRRVCSPLHRAARRPFVLRAGVLRWPARGLLKVPCGTSARKVAMRHVSTSSIESSCLPRRRFSVWRSLRTTFTASRWSQVPNALSPRNWSSFSHALTNASCVSSSARVRSPTMRVQSEKILSRAAGRVVRTPDGRRGRLARRRRSIG